MRTYEKTHPWLKFALDTQRLPYTCWLLLGEAVSKVEHIAGVPMDPEAARELHRLYLAKGVLATTAIEGNTLTEQQVREYIAGKLRLPNSMQYLGQEIDNIVEACNLIGQAVLQTKSGPISVDEIRDYNRLVLRSLPLLDGVVPGELRKHSVGVGGYRAVPQEDCEFLLGQFCTWLNDLKLPGNLEVPYSILAAIAAHLYFVWIHPFGDGNGRTARLIEFRYLLQAGFPTPAAHLLSNFYNMTRAKYYQQLDNASRSNGRMEDFIAYALEGLVDQLREQLRVIRESQLKVTWHNYVHERFTTSSRTDVRRRNLVLELSKVMVNEGWVKTSDLPELSARVVQAYSAKTQKTLSRDLNALSEMGLVERGGRQVRANKNLILAFLPERLVADS